MTYGSSALRAISLCLLLGCESGIRDLDFVSKRFTATFNVDSTQGIDSTNLSSFINSTAIYSFGEKGKGTNHVQTGMLSKDTPFTWKVQGDSLYIDKEGYVVEKDVKGYVLRSDSAKIFLTLQP